MPLTLPPFNFAIICDGKELETYDVKEETLEEGPDSITAFVASEAGKVSVPKVPFVSTRKTDCRDQQFRVAMTNNLSNFDLCFALHIDGKYISGMDLRAGHQGELWGIRNSDTTRLPFKFQELELVGAFHHSFDNMIFPHLLLKTQTWNMPPSRQKWGRLNFELFGARSCAVNGVNDVMQTMDCIKEVYRSAARRQGGIMSGTPPPEPPVQFSSTCETH